MTQLQAGYLLYSIFDTLKPLSDFKVRGLVESLSYFEVEGVSQPETKPSIDSLVAVVNNLICRGLPTIPSIFIEELVSGANKIEEYGTIKYPLSHEKNDILRALHLYDPEWIPNPKEYEPSLDSNFESFVLEIMQYNAPYLPQILQQQRPLSSITHHGFTGQRVDFSFESPYLEAFNVPSPFDKRTVLQRTGVVIEVDGPTHQVRAQLIQDAKRDEAIENEKWKAQRIDGRTGEGDTRKTIAALRDNYEYIKVLRENHENPLPTETLETALCPFAIARLQKTIIELIACEQLSLDAETWNFTIIERDVPCSYAAIDDLQQIFEHLFALENKGRSLPEINLTVYGDTRFISSRVHLGKPVSPIDDFSADEMEAADFLIDVSVLRRSGYENTRMGIESNKFIRIRSSHYQYSDRVFYTSNLISYREVVEKNADDGYTEIPDAVAHLTYFVQSVFRKKAFRPGQLPIVNRAIQGKTVIGLLPTGGGKSLTYQLAALLQPGIAMVVAPLRSLMKDQYDNLLKIGIDASLYINSVLSTTEKALNTGRLANGQTLFAFISPERLLIKTFRKTLEQMHMNKIYFSYGILDEVHCVSEWGHDFRTSYLKLGDNITKHCKGMNGNVPLFGLTATASFDVLADVERELLLENAPDLADATVRFENMKRDELQFEVVEVLPRYLPNGRPDSIEPVKQDVLKDLIECLPQSLSYYGQMYGSYPKAKYNESATLESLFFFDGKEACLHGGLIFCPVRSGFIGVTDEYKRRWDVATNQWIPKTPKEGVAEILSATFPHIKVGTFLGAGNDGGEELTERVTQESMKNQDEFVNSKSSVMVATKAFGMGIDKPNIRFTIHMNIPSSIESFVQEAGRAGRDKNIAVSYLLFTASVPSLDTNVLDFFHGNSFKGEDTELMRIDELLTEIWVPNKSSLATIEAQYRERTENEESSLWLNYWNGGGNRRIFINPGGNYVRVSPTLECVPSDKDEITITIQKLIEEKIASEGITTIAALDEWASKKVPQPPTLGIEMCLKQAEIGERVEVIIPRKNVYAANPEEHTRKMQEFVRAFDNTITPEHIMMVKSPLDKGLPCDTQLTGIENMTTKKLTDSDKKEFERLYNLPRTGADTDRAIYRLFCIGVITDYTLDYKTDCYTVQATRPEKPTHYYNCLRAYVCRYYSDARADKELSVIDLQDEPNLIRNCIKYLVSFAYKEIVAKRKAGIADMVEAATVGLNQGNEDLKEYIDVYFNSKYIKAGYIAKLDDSTMGTAYSLRESTDDAKIELSFERIIEFIEVLRLDRSGSEIDNTKHLRGAATRLLRANPKNGSLLLLKAFTLFVLANRIPSLLQEAESSVIEGLLLLQKDKGYSEEIILDYLAQYAQLTIDRVNDEAQTRVKQSIDRCLNNFQLFAHADWLSSFTSKFLHGYES